ncbi:Membrane protein involved in the export of O-antigen and teichoic acid [Halovenus aranensis]|uniref:Membrane protein involved in the export of O-antigen and teichoic acid n=1 Tax=Halovenus aranensis TaxID=890420 RepID=A0A1G8YVD1_9EURY|nr:polysaccharide biosynthesis C-terminal domain-containing protein [Halovenus aranensis]SDK06743.1 Membrane protein involved in the export of O-antigen and teichoic acid [Halovenus aranensis]
MKIGQTSIIVFVSQLIASAVGFLSTLYFARTLGTEVMGLYALVMTFSSWLMLSADLGIGEAMKKRISEGEGPNQGKFLVAAVVWTLSILGVLSLGLVLFEPWVTAYIDEFDVYVSTAVIWFVIAVLFARLFSRTVFRLLVAQRMVHIRGLLDIVNIGGKTLFQVGLVLLGYSLAGMLIGWVLGGIVVGVVGLRWITVSPARPTREHFTSLFDYAKFSWLGKLESRAFNQVDILLLGVFVSAGSVGVYSVAWSIAKFIELFGSSISRTIFPEISFKSSQASKQSTVGLIEDALAYTGLIAIPGLVGGSILAEHLLRLYGPEFRRGAAVLALLILATLIYSYQSQFLNALNALDRPDITFRINAVFVALNVILNLALISQFGIEGAAVATVFSTVVGLFLSYVALSRLIDFDIPIREPTKQVISAFVMGGVVWITLGAIETVDILNNALVVALLVPSGAAVYFLTLFVISPPFRATVDRNVPIGLPFVS